MTRSVLHYIVEPYCGWTYAALPLLNASKNIENLEVRLHCGGMLAAGRRKKVSEAWRSYVIPQDQRIAQLSDQQFGKDYFDGLLRNTQVVFDSEPPSAAILAAESLGGCGLKLLNAIQQAHYVSGLDISQESTLLALAGNIGINEIAFAKTFRVLLGLNTHKHFHASMQLMEKVQGNGFPSVGLEADQGCFKPLPLNQFYGQPKEWQRYLINNTL
ncbi:DsbA family protein [Spongorhabdus nitratireducens]